jgi:hypothetical protein
MVPACVLWNAFIFEFRKWIFERDLFLSEAERAEKIGPPSCLEIYRMNCENISKK